MMLFAELKAAIYNGLLPREDKRAWEPSDFYSEYPEPEPELMELSKAALEERVQDEIKRWEVMLDTAARFGNADMANEEK